MRRREFLTAIAGSVAPWPAHAQEPVSKMPRIGIIDNASIWDNFRKGLQELGYSEGRNIAIEYRSAEGNPDRLAAAASELVRLPVDLIATYGTAATSAAKRATATIPIVMLGVGDPLRAGLVASLSHPGGNVTGNSILGPAVVGKRLQLLKLAVPTISHVACLWNPNNASHASYLDDWKAAGQALGVKILLVEVRNSDEFAGAFDGMIRERSDAFTMTADPMHQLHIGWIIDFLARNRLPAIYQEKENVVAGGLMSYGVDLPDLFRRGAGYVDKILRGMRPAELPVEQPTKFELVVNLDTAKALGLTLPQSFILLADKVIE